MYLAYGDTTIINTTGLGSKAGVQVGVYVADGENNTIYYNHGIGDRNFASYSGTTPTNAGLDRFVN
ncbi:hypothetical protein, partial [Klebsiella pneumoniae]|uniref:hypothetical protein n=1 Tax=Klebsiella pneumoniae TaxID=573 RepID=UPI0025A0438B